ncbi:MAG TPA: hypothetical protein VIJ70_06840, partial [Gaiellaceae bacterium]
MSILLAANDVQFSVSAFAPLAVGFFGLGTGYLIYGPQELFGLPGRDRAVDISTGIWGIWMPGFMQFLAGTYLWIGLAWFHSFREAPLYMAALAFTAYGVHWWAIGLTRALGGDPRPAGFMSIAFTVLSVLGALVFFKASDPAVGILFVGLAGVYVCDLFASLGYREVSHDGGPPVRERTSLGDLGERMLGAVHLATGGWLMYLTFAATVNAALGWTWWL